jgi:predicted kinase
MKEIIWVYGTSASGKETFIRELINNDELKKLLKIENVPIAISNDSQIHLGKLDDGFNVINFNW